MLASTPITSLLIRSSSFKHVLSRRAILILILHEFFIDFLRSFELLHEICMPHNTPSLQGLPSPWHSPAPPSRSFHICCCFALIGMCVSHILVYVHICCVYDLWVVEKNEKVIMGNKEILCHRHTKAECYVSEVIKTRIIC